MRSKNMRIDTAFMGYGHYKIVVTYSAYSGFIKEAISGDMDLIRRFKSEDKKEREEATDEAIAYVESQSL